MVANAKQSVSYIDSVQNERKDLSPREVAKLIGVGKDTVLHYIHSGELFAWNSSNNPAKRRYKIPLDALEKFKRLRSIRPPRLPSPPRRSPSPPRYNTNRPAS